MTHTNPVAERYHRIQEEIAEIALRSQRHPSDVKLVAVSKGYSWDHVQQAYNAGCRDFGESRIPEALPKIAEAPNTIQWHFIGSLQRNKVRKAVGNFVLIHSVDSLELAQKISAVSEEQHLNTPILLQVNTSQEPTKHGLTPERWLPLMEALLALPALQIQGLMTMAPLTDDEAIIRRCFAHLRAFKDLLNLKYNLQLHHLSMGMSHDFRLAIEEGATLVRIGTAIFG